MVMIMLHSSVMTTDGFLVYEECDRFGQIFCMGMKGNQVSFEMVGCLKAKDCDVVLRAANGQPEDWVKWSLVTPSNKSIIKAALVPKSLVTDIIQSDSVTKTNFRAGTLFMQGSGGTASVHFVDVSGTDITLSLAEVNGRAIWPTDKPVLGGVSQDADEKVKQQKFSAYFFQSKNSIVLLRGGKIRYGVKTSEKLFPTLMEWDNGILRNKAVSYTPASTPIGFEIFQESPWSPKPRPDPRRSTTRGPFITIPDGQRPDDPVDPEPSGSKSRSSKKKNFIWLWVLIGILVLAFICLITYFIIRRRKKKNKTRHHRVSNKKTKRHAAGAKHATVDAAPAPLYTPPASEVYMSKSTFAPSKSSPKTNNPV